MLAQPPLWVTLLAFIVALGPLVFIHEMGHYLVARWFGIPAETFSIGFGKELVGWNDKRGTRWRIAALPLGGYVKFVGDMTPASNPTDEADIAPEDRERAFQFRPVWQRFLVVLAGPAANFLAAIAIFAAFFMAFSGPSANVVGSVAPGSAAAAAGIEPGDRITSIAGRDTSSFEDIRSTVMLRPNEVVPVTFERGGVERTVSASIQSDVITDPYGETFKRGLLGVMPSAERLAPLGPIEAVHQGAVATWRITVAMVDGLVQIVTGRRGVDDLGGPIKIAKVAGQQANLGWLPFVQLIALFSINLGFINLLPVPMLDGGHLAFYAVEAVRRRPVSARAMDWAFRGGMALLLALVLFTTVNDLGFLS